MRIISGKFGGRLIEGSSSLNVRPTTDRAREAIFSSLESRLVFDGLRVLDLYAGTGALGLEAISRGAEYCVFVEKSPKTCKTLTANVAKLDLKSCTLIECVDSRKFVAKSSIATPFGLVLVDPPYGTLECLELLVALRESPLIEEGSIVVFEDSRAQDLSGLTGFKILTEKKYGKTFVVMFERTEDAV